MNDLYEIGQNLLVGMVLLTSLALVLAAGVIAITVWGDSPRWVQWLAWACRIGFVVFLAIVLGAVARTDK